MFRSVRLGIAALLLGLASALLPSLPARAAPSNAPAQQAARPTLRRGATGPAVRELQQLLNNWLLVAPLLTSRPLAVDGVFGAVVEERVRLFQEFNALAVDGVVGPRTWTALLTFRRPTPALDTFAPPASSGQPAQAPPAQVTPPVSSGQPAQATRPTLQL